MCSKLAALLEYLTAWTLSISYINFTPKPHKVVDSVTDLDHAFSICNNHTCFEFLLEKTECSFQPQ